MDWVQNVQRAINYIEDNLLEDISSDRIAGSVYTSSAHFQRIFGMVTGYTVQDYIRNRRLSLAGEELRATGQPVVDIALKYGYETHESFSKAFARFHGVTPSAARKNKDSLKCFQPLTIHIDITGGFNISRKLISNVPLISISADGFSYLTSFTGALYGALRGIGEEVGSAELLALSGFGNRLCWTEGMWVFGNEAIENCNATPFEMEARLMGAIGWGYRRVAVERDAEGVPVNTCDGAIRRDFVNSLDRGIPVLAQGITDDGCKHDYDVFYGYEDDGRTIVGWDYYQNDDKPFIRENWERELQSYVILTDRRGLEPERRRALAMFRTVETLARRGILRGKKLGFAAWETFLHQLEHDDFSRCTLHAAGGEAEEPDGVGSLEQRFVIYCDALTQISQRGAILPYYQKLAAAFPEWAVDLSAVIESWRECAAYGGYLWGQGFTFDDAGFERFRDPHVRRILAEEGRRAMAKDAEAVGRIEAILHREGRNGQASEEKTDKGDENQ